jgi:hypothetical protein
MVTDLASTFAAAGLMVPVLSGSGDAIDRQGLSCRSLGHPNRARERRVQRMFLYGPAYDWQPLGLQVVSQL